MSSFKNKLVKLFFPLTKVDVAYLVLVLSVANVLVGNIKFRFYITDDSRSKLQVTTGTEISYIYKRNQNRRRPIAEYFILHMSCCSSVLFQLVLVLSVAMLAMVFLMKIVVAGLLVAWHYREVPKDRREALFELAASIYKK